MTELSAFDEEVNRLIDAAKRGAAHLQTDNPSVARTPQDLLYVTWVFCWRRLSAELTESVIKRGEYLPWQIEWAKTRCGDGADTPVTDCPMTYRTVAGKSYIDLGVMVPGVMPLWYHVLRTVFG